MPFYDRSIDIVIATAQTPAQVGGLTSVLSRYQVAAIVRSAAQSRVRRKCNLSTSDIAIAEQNGTRLVISRNAGK